MLALKKHRHAGRARGFFGNKKPLEVATLKIRVIQQVCSFVYEVQCNKNSFRICFTVGNVISSLLLSWFDFNNRSVALFIRTTWNCIGPKMIPEPEMILRLYRK